MTATRLTLMQIENIDLEVDFDLGTHSKIHLFRAVLPHFFFILGAFFCAELIVQGRQIVVVAQMLNTISFLIAMKRGSTDNFSTK